MRTKVFLEYLLFAGLVLFILLALFIYREGEWTVLFFVPLSYLCAHFFMSHRGKKVIIFFFLTWLVLLASAGLHFFDPFSELL